MDVTRQMFHALRPAFRALQQDCRPCRFRQAPRSFSRPPAVSRPLSVYHSPSLERAGIRAKKPTPRLVSRTQARWNTPTSEEQPPTSERAEAAPSVPAAPEDETPPVNVPSFELQFTCKPCFHRSTHRVSKQGYTTGTVIITCPKCKARHLISDHLKIFRDKSVTIEDILREKGETFKKGQLDPTGDFELWEDGGRTRRQRDRKAKEAKLEAAGLARDSSSETI